MLGVSISVILTVIVILPLALFSLNSVYKLVQAWNGFALWFLEFTCGLGFVVTGKENIPRDPSYIVFAKHQSAWETMALQHIFKLPLAWVSKRGLFWVPFFGWALYLIKAIGINRSSGKKAVEQLKTEGKERLDVGIKIVIFPEGTRIAPGKLGKFKYGGSALAEHTGAPIVPVAHNAGRFWRRRSLTKHPGTIQMKIGKPIITKGKNAQEINQEVYAWMEQAMQEVDKEFLS